MADLTENLFDAIQILVDNSIKAIKFDETINVTIVDASEAKNGKYIVSNGSSKFTAYSSVTNYKENDAVMVTIPQGNYDNEKIIIGKATNNSNSPLIYKSPFETLVNLTDNIILEEINPVGFWANYESNGNDASISDGYAWPEGTLFSKSETYKTIEITNGNEVIEYKKPGCIWDSGPVFYQNYGLLGLQAQFSTWLADYSTAYGNYGLMLEITFADPETKEPLRAYSCQLDSDDFFGDIYNFETYYTQEKVFDISEYADTPIVRLRLFPYQRCNFKSIDGEKIPTIEEDNFSTIPPNIFIKDFFVCLGAPMESITNDSVEIMTDSSLNYYKEKNIDENLSITAEMLAAAVKEKISTTDNNKDKIAYKQLADNELLYYTINEITFNQLKEAYKTLLCDFLNDENFDLNDLSYNFYNNTNNRTDNNLKTIQLRWIHIYEDGAKIVSMGEMPENYEIQWYRYKLGAPSIKDSFAGAHWERYYGKANSVNDKTGDWAITNPENDQTTNSTIITLQPNVNNKTEKIKAIIIKKEVDSFDNVIDKKIAVSNVLEFTNETPIRDTVTVEDVSILRIQPEDEYNGNYFLYNRAGKLGKNEWGAMPHTLTAIYNNSPLQLEDCSSIKWRIPLKNTMIKAIDVNDEVDEKIYENVTSISYLIKEYLNNNADNNIIKLEVLKDGLKYEASIALHFGTSGTNGSDYTLTIDWKDNKSVINVNDNTDFISGRVKLFDASGSEIEIPTDTNIDIDWAVATDCDLSEENKNYEFEEETTKFYYPVVFYDIDERSIWRLIGESFYNHNKRRQPVEPTPTINGFYYFADGNINNITNYDDYYYYNLDTNKFEHWNKTKNYSDTNISFLGPVYRKQRTNEQTYIKTKDTVVNPDKVYYIGERNSDKTYSINQVNNPTNDGLKSYLEPGPDKRYKIKFQEIKLSVEKWNNNRRYFIKRNNQYIVDPWLEYQPDETYYEPILESPIIRDDKILENKLIITSNGQEFIINQAENCSPSINSIYILKITLSNFGDYPLSVSYPIALQKIVKWGSEGQHFSQLKYIEGPTEVRYATTGETDFNKNPYKCFGVRNISDQFVYYTHEFNPNDVPEGYVNIDNIRWRLLVAENNWNPQENNQFNPSLEETSYSGHQKVSEIIDGYPAYHAPILKPPALYYKDAAPYAVQCVTLKEDNEHFNNVLWTQPIFVYQDNYPSTTLNQWNGKDITTDDDTGTIVANGFAAGRKNTDNTFSGVVLGDWSRTDTDRSFATQETGVYGFNHGAMSYALKDDGTAFFGKDGHGRIYIDGNSATIKSALWRYDKPEGMMLDLDDGIMEIRKGNNSIQINSNGTYDGDYPFAIGQDGQRNFLVQWDGTLTTKKGNIAGWQIEPAALHKQVGRYEIGICSNPNGWKTGDGEYYEGWTDTSNLDGNAFLVKKDGDYVFAVKHNGRLISKAGNIAGWEIENNALKKEKKNTANGEIEYYCRLLAPNNPSNTSNAIEIGTKNAKNFSVRYDGYLTSTSGKIGGWTINGTSLKRTNGSTLTLGDSNFAINSNNFKVSYDGTVTAKNLKIESGANITGSIKATSYKLGNYTFGVKTIPIITRVVRNGDSFDMYAQNYYVVCGANAGSEYKIYPVEGGGGGGGCFVSGTKVLMANGIYKNIEDIQKNEFVLSYNEDTNNFVISKVINTLIHHNTFKTMLITLEDKTEIEATLSHPFLTTEGWKTIDIKTGLKEHGILCGNLAIGQTIIGINKNLKIKNISYKNYSLGFNTFNITVEKYHSYIVNNCIVHNSFIKDMPLVV